jgi:hypothetical protein
MNAPIPFVAMVVAIVVTMQSFSALAQGTSFTYQGRLSTLGTPSNGTYDLRFGLYSVNSGGSVVGSYQTNSSVSISNGLFTCDLNLGNNFDGSPP